eukprot:2869248-Pyramimonas_sp.AAC.1
MHPEGVFFGQHSNHFRTVTLGGSDGAGTFQIQEGVLPGHQSAPVKNIRSYDRSVPVPWLEARRARPGGQDL